MTLMRKIFGPTNVVALQKIIQAITGLGTAFMVTHFLSAEEQGYYYTIGCILSSYIIFDLGLSSYLLQKSAQLSHGLEINESGQISPIGKSRDKFIAFAHWTFNWYRNAGITALLILAPVGIYILSRNNDSAIDFNWFWPWILIAISIGLSMPSIGFFSIMEGANLIKETYLLRITHYIIGALFAWYLIGLGRGLYSQAAPLIATVIVCYGWIFYKYRNLYQEKPKPIQSDITSSILPKIKYTFCIWLSNYIFLNVPVILNFISGRIEESGQLGLSLIIANIGGAIAFSPSTASLPKVINKLHSNENRVANQIFFLKLKVSLFIYFFGTLLLISVATYSNNEFFSRILRPIELGILLLVFAGFHILNIFLIYFQAQDNYQLSLRFLILNLSILFLYNYIFNKLGTVGILLSMAILIMILCINVIIQFLAIEGNKK